MNKFGFVTKKDERYFAGKQEIVSGSRHLIKFPDGTDRVEEFYIYENKLFVKFPHLGGDAFMNAIGSGIKVQT